MIPILGEHIVQNESEKYMKNEGISLFNLMIDAAQEDELEVFDV